MDVRDFLRKPISILNGFATLLVNSQFLDKWQSDLRVCARSAMSAVSRKRRLFLVCHLSVAEFILIVTPGSHRHDQFLVVT